jgi:hypothetical protein
MVVPPGCEGGPALRADDSDNMSRSGSIPEDEQIERADFLTVDAGVDATPTTMVT